MSPILLIGVLLFVGFFGGEAAKWVGLPKVTGFILAGVLLDPSLLGLMPADFTSRTDFVTNVALSFITFSVGGTLRFSRIRRLGKDIVLVTLCKAEFAFLVVVVNFSPLQKKVFKVLERYTEELIFVLFFTLSGMHLDLAVFAANLPLVAVFILARSVGKMTGAVTGATLAAAPGKVRKYVAGGLIPQGGIVVGLALLMRQNPALAGVAGIVINVIIGATVIHEILGPVLSRAAIKAAGEIPAHR